MQLITDMFVHKTRFMKFKKIINLKYTIMLTNITNFRKFESCYKLFSNELS